MRTTAGQHLADAANLWSMLVQTKLILPCSVQIFKTTWQLIWMQRKNEIGRDLSLGWVSDEYPLLQQTRRVLKLLVMRTLPSEMERPPDPGVQQPLVLMLLTTYGPTPLHKTTSMAMRIFHVVTFLSSRVVLQQPKGGQIFESMITSWHGKFSHYCPLVWRIK